MTSGKSRSPNVTSSPSNPKGGPRWQEQQWEKQMVCLLFLFFSLTFSSSSQVPFHSDDESNDDEKDDTKPNGLNKEEKKKRKADRQEIFNGVLKGDQAEKKKKRKKKEREDEVEWGKEEEEEEIGLDSLGVEEVEIPWGSGEKPPYEPFIHLQKGEAVHRIYVLFWKFAPVPFNKKNFMIRKKDGNTMEVEVHIPPISQQAWEDIEGLEHVISMTTKKVRVLKFPLQMPHGYMMEVSSVCPYRNCEFLFGFSCNVIPVGEVEF